MIFLLSLLVILILFPVSFPVLEQTLQERARAESITYDHIDNFNSKGPNPYSQGQSRVEGNTNPSEQLNLFGTSSQVSIKPPSQHQQNLPKPNTASESLNVGVALSLVLPRRAFQLLLHC
ncbi:hypothetical protein Tco_0532093 [Tanacetum coccineum]